MFRTRFPRSSNLLGAPAYEGNSLAREIEKFQEEGGEIEMGSPLLYTKKSDGVRPETNIRTDRFEMAQNRMQAAYEAENAQRAKQRAEKDAKKDTPTPEQTPTPEPKQTSTPETTSE